MINEHFQTKYKCKEGSFKKVKNAIGAHELN